MKTLYQFVLAIAAVLLPIQHATAQSTRSVIVNTNALLTTGFLPYAVSSTRVAPGPIARVDASTVAVSNQVLSATLTRGTTALSGPAATIDWDTSDRYTWTIAAASTGTHANVPTGGGTVQYVSLTVTSPGGLTIDFVFPGGVTTNWVSNFVRIPRAGQTEFGFSPRGSIMDIWAVPDAYAIADGEVYRRASGTNGFGVVTGTGDVVGPASATDNALARFDGATGKLIQSSAVSVADNGAFTFPTGVRQVFRPDANVSGFNVGTVPGDPTFYVDGDLWYDSLAVRLRAGINGTAVTLGAGGGSALWASTSSLLIPSPAVNVVAIESQSSDAATNQVLILDSGAEWTVNGPKSISIRNNGVEQAYQQINGAIAIGESTDSFWVPDGSDIIAGVRDAAIGDASVFNVYFAAVDNAAAASIWGDTLISGSSVSGNSSLFMTSNNGVNDSAFTIFGTPTGFSLTATANAATNFFVGSTSGYTGAGTKFLSDDGTYKTAGGGGDTIWTNVSGTIKPLSGQTTNRLSFTSGAADNATNALFVVDSANYLTANGTKLVEVSNAGTNNFVVSRNGGLTIGRGSVGWWGGLSEGGETIISVRDIALGEPNFNDVFIGVNNSGNSDISYAEFLQSSTTSAFEVKANTTTGMGRIIGEFAADSAKLRMGTDDGIWVTFHPTIASTGSAVAHFVDTSNVLTNGDSLFQVRNQGVTRLDVTAAGAITGRLPVDYGFACSDETSALTTTTNAVRWRAPHAFTLTGVRASLTTTQSSGSIATFDLKKNGTSVLSTLVSIDNGETTSVTAATPPVISTTAFADDDIIVISITQVGTGGTGAKFTIKGYR